MLKKRLFTTLTSLVIVCTFIFSSTNYAWAYAVPGGDNCENYIYDENPSVWETATKANEQSNVENSAIERIAGHFSSLVYNDWEKVANGSYALDKDEVRIISEEFDSSEFENGVIPFSTVVWELNQGYTDEHVDGDDSAYRYEPITDIQYNPDLEMEYDEDGYPISTGFVRVYMPGKNGIIPYAKWESRNWSDDDTRVGFARKKFTQYTPWFYPCTNLYTYEGELPQTIKVCGFC